MIIVIKKGADATQVENLKTLLRSKNIQQHVSEGSLQTVQGREPQVPPGRLGD